MKAINDARQALIKEMLGKAGAVLFYGLVALVILPAFLEYGPKAWNWLIGIGVFLGIGLLYSLFQETRKFKSFVSKYIKIAKEVAARKITKEQKKCTRGNYVIMPQLSVLLGEIKNSLNDAVDLDYINALLAKSKTFPCRASLVQQPTDHEFAVDGVANDVSRAYCRLYLFDSSDRDLAHIELI